MLEKKVSDILIHQMRNWWLEFDEEVIKKYISQALNEMEENYKEMSSSRYQKDGQIIINPVYSVTWNIFLYRLSRILYLNSYVQEANCIYYLNKIMHSNDWFYEVELPIHFGAEHPLGSVLGKAKYDDYLFVYQGTTIGGNRKDDTLTYPIIGKNVCLYANATVLGSTVLGDNVIVAANTYLLNENIPSNCIVYGKSPNIVIKKKTEATIKNMTKHIWRWNN